ncbi:MAG: choice-of-anchor D domain-containing protein [bacterium]
MIVKRATPSLRSHRSVLFALICLCTVFSLVTNSLRSQVTLQPVAVSVKVSPDTIDFQRLHVGRTSDSSFTISSPNGNSFDLVDSSFSKSIHSGQFISDPGKISVTRPGEFIKSVVHFHPTKRGSFKDMLSIQTAQGVSTSITIRGIGIDCVVHDSLYDFKKVKVGATSSLPINVGNSGDDTTTIASVVIVDTLDGKDFGLVSQSLPQAQPSKWLLQFRGPDSVKTYQAFFAPTASSPVAVTDSRVRTALVRITSTDGRSYYDTLIGRAVEPWIEASPMVFDFGVISNPPASSPAIVSLPGSITNSGSASAILSGFSSTHDTLFFISAATGPLNVAEQSTFPFSINFKVDFAGDFIDTVFINNDSRNKPLLILKAKVRARSPHNNKIFYDTVRTCTPIDTVFTVSNPTRVPILLQDFRIAGGSGGFELLDTDSNQYQIHNGVKVRLTFPFYIGPNSDLVLHLRYRFPQDSGNGNQIAKFILIEPTGGDDAVAIYDTLELELNRKANLLYLTATKPKMKPSSTDAPFRLPIHLGGKRFGETEIDTDTLRIVFSNAMIRPIGVDRSNSFTEESPKNNIPPQPQPSWDEPTLTYSIPCTGLHISSDVGKDSLVITLLCKAYVTEDTSTVISIGYTKQKCGLIVPLTSTTVQYADECGDVTVRNYYLNQNPFLRITSIYPVPATRAEQGITCEYRTRKGAELSWKLYDQNGVLLTESSGFKAGADFGSFQIPMKQIPVSGTLYLRVYARDTVGDSDIIVHKTLVIIG